MHHRSTKSEKMYPSMLSRGPDVEIEPYYCLPVGTVPGGNVMVPWSQPTSPTPPTRGFAGLLSPTHTNAPHRLTYPKKNDEGEFIFLQYFLESQTRSWKSAPGGLGCHFLWGIINNFARYFLFPSLSSRKSSLAPVWRFIAVRFDRGTASHGGPALEAGAHRRPGSGDEPFQPAVN